MNIKDLESRAGEAAALLKAMSNPHRLSILCRLLGGERRVSELEETGSLSQSALSQHLAKLRASGLVTTRRDAQNIHYALADDDARQVLEVLHRIFCDMAPERRREAAGAEAKRGAQAGRQSSVGLRRKR